MKECNLKTIKERIVCVASELFIRNGVKAVTMNEVATKLGISKRTLYEHFDNKDELLKTCVRLQHSADIERIRASSKDIIELMYDFYFQAKRYAHMINRNYYRDMKRYYPDVFALVEENQDYRRDQIIEIIKDGIEKGLIRENINPEISALLFKGQFDFLWLSDDISTEKYSAGDILSEIIVNFIRGISTQKGIDELDKLIGSEK